MNVARGVVLFIPIHQYTITISEGHRSILVCFGRGGDSSSLDKFLFEINLKFLFEINLKSVKYMI